MELFVGYGNGYVFSRPPWAYAYGRCIILFFLIPFLGISYIVYLLSNNYVNELINSPFDDTHEELLGYYISLLKTLSLSFNESTVQFFYSRQVILRNTSPSSDSNGLPPVPKEAFPLFTRAIKYYSHEETMVRTAVRAISLNVFHTPDFYLRQFLCTNSDCSHFLRILSEQFRKRILRLGLSVTAWSTKLYLNEKTELQTNRNKTITDSSSSPTINSLSTSSFFHHLVSLPNSANVYPQLYTASSSSSTIDRMRSEIDSYFSDFLDECFYLQDILMIAQDELEKYPGESNENRTNSDNEASFRKSSKSKNKVTGTGSFIPFTDRLVTLLVEEVLEPLLIVPLRYLSEYVSGNKYSSSIQDDKKSLELYDPAAILLILANILNVFTYDPLVYWLETQLTIDLTFVDSYGTVPSGNDYQMLADIPFEFLNGLKTKQSWRIRDTVLQGISSSDERISSCAMLLLHSMMKLRKKSNFSRAITGCLPRKNTKDCTYVRVSSPVSVNISITDSNANDKTIKNETEKGLRTPKRINKQELYESSPSTPRIRAMTSVPLSVTETINNGYTHDHNTPLNRVIDATTTSSTVRPKRLSDFTENDIDKSIVGGIRGLRVSVGELEDNSLSLSSSVPIASETTERLPKLNTNNAQSIVAETEKRNNVTILRSLTSEEFIFQQQARDEVAMVLLSVIARSDPPRLGNILLALCILLDLMYHPIDVPNIVSLDSVKSSVPTFSLKHIYTIRQSIARLTDTVVTTAETTNNDENMGEKGSEFILPSMQMLLLAETLSDDEARNSPVLARGIYLVNELYGDPSRFLPSEASSVETTGSSSSSSSSNISSTSASVPSIVSPLPVPPTNYKGITKKSVDVFRNLVTQGEQLYVSCERSAYLYPVPNGSIPPEWLTNYENINRYVPSWLRFTLRTDKTTEDPKFFTFGKVLQQLLILRSLIYGLHDDMLNKFIGIVYGNLYKLPTGETDNSLKLLHYNLNKVTQGELFSNVWLMDPWIRLIAPPFDSIEVGNTFTLSSLSWHPGIHIPLSFYTSKNVVQLIQGLDEKQKRRICIVLGQSYLVIAELLTSKNLPTTTTTNQSNPQSSGVPRTRGRALIVCPLHLTIVRHFANIPGIMDISILAKDTIPLATGTGSVHVASSENSNTIGNPEVINEIQLLNKRNIQHFQLYSFTLLVENMELQNKITQHVRTAQERITSGKLIALKNFRNFSRVPSNDDTSSNTNTSVTK